MNRSDLITKLLDLYPKMTRKEIDSLVKILFSNMVDNIADGNRIEVRGFGCFSLKERFAGIVRNPRDGVSIESNDSRFVVYFRAGKELKNRVDNV
jgi:integration host factor subunit beta